MRRWRFWALAACSLVWVSACGASAPEIHSFLGSTDLPDGQTVEVIGKIGPRGGSDVYLSTRTPNVPPVGARGRLDWVLRRQEGTFARGTALSLANVQVKAVQPGRILLTITSDSAPISMNGNRVNVMKPGEWARLVYVP